MLILPGPKQCEKVGSYRDVQFFCFTFTFATQEEAEKVSLKSE